MSNINDAETVKRVSYMIVGLVLVEVVLILVAVAIA